MRLKELLFCGPEITIFSLEIITFIPQNATAPEYIL